MRKSRISSMRESVSCVDGQELRECHTASGWVLNESLSTGSGIMTIAARLRNGVSAAAA